MNGRTPAKAFRDGIPKHSKKDDKIDLKTAGSLRRLLSADIHLCTHCDHQHLKQIVPSGVTRSWIVQALKAGRGAIHHRLLW